MGFFNCLTVYTSKKYPKITQNAANFFPIQSKVAGKGPELIYMHPKNCYKMLKAFDESGRQNWVSKACNLLFTCGFGYISIAQDVGDIGMFISQFKQRLTDCMTQRWHADITESSRCDTYKEFN